MRYCFTGLHLFMLAEIHSEGFPLSITINYLVIYKASQKISFAGRIILLRAGVTNFGPRVTERAAAM